MLICGHQKPFGHEGARALLTMPLLQLYGGGYINALLQTSCTYYIACIVLHWIAPRVLPVQNIQVQSRQPGQVSREAFNSLGRAPNSILMSALTYQGPMHCHREISHAVADLVFLHRPNCREGLCLDNSRAPACQWMGHAL